MTKEKDIKTVVPTLRFPEFRDTEGWSEKKVGDALENKSSQVALNKLELQEKGYPVYGADGVVGYISDYTQGKDYISIVKDGSGVGRIALRQKESSVLGTLNCLTSKNETIFLLTWLYYQLQQLDFSSYIKGGGIPHIYYSDYKNHNIYIPKPKEQQKIADCFSSLDDLISAEVDKIEALKEHKKGLMQQLFPAGGKTTPALRFPEFQNAGEWKITLLSDLGITISGLTYSPDDVRDSGLLVLRSSNIKNGSIVLDDCVYVTPKINRANLAQPNDILICVRNGSVSLIGKNALIPEGMPPCTHGAFMSIFRAKNPSFVFQLLQTDIYQSQVNADLGARINSINCSQLNKYKFPVATIQEQQIIAECLSSIDKLISAETNKLDQLKAHKKGLMQQLFPNIE